MLDEVEQGQQELTLLGEESGELGGIERGSSVGSVDDLIASGHRWWLLVKVWQAEGMSLQLGAATDFFRSTFHYGRDIIREGRLGPESAPPSPRRARPTTKRKRELVRSDRAGER